MKLVIDIETTGLTPLSFVTERNYKQWPRLVQLAWGLLGKNSIKTKHSAIIKPTRFVIPYQATRIHKITQKRAEAEGEDLLQQLKALNEAMQAVDTIIAHNINFDLGVIQSEAMRLVYEITFPDKRECTAYLGQAYLRKEKGQRLAGFPRLEDLHEKLCGCDYAPKHEASSDMTACAAVYGQLSELGYTK